MRLNRAARVVRSKRRTTSCKSSTPFDLKDIDFTLVSDELTMAEIDAMHVRMIRAAQAFRRLTFV